MLRVLTLSSKKTLAAGHSQILFLPTEVWDAFPKWWPRPKSLFYKMRCETMSQVNTLKNRLQRFLEQAFFIPACAICSAMHQVRLTEAKNSIFPSKCPKNWFLEKNVGEGISTYPSFFQERSEMPNSQRKGFDAYSQKKMENKWILGEGN